MRQRHLYFWSHVGRHFWSHVGEGGGPSERHVTLLIFFNRIGKKNPIFLHSFTTFVMQPWRQEFRGAKRSARGRVMAGERDSSGHLYEVFVAGFGFGTHLK